MSFVRWALVVVPLVVLLGFLSGRSVPVGSENRWYQVLAKPGFTPPDWAFPVVWGLLYILLGLALALVLSARGARWRWLAVALFAAQLLLNLAWTPVFFGMHQVQIALLMIVGIELLSIAAAVVFAYVRPAATLLMLPYLAWIALAGALTWEIGRLNPDAATLVPPVASSHVIG